MLRRKIDTALRQFLSSDEKKCLMVQGARQVGKTFSVDQLGADPTAVDSYISVNFLKNPDLKQIFTGNLDVNSLLLNFSVFMPDKRFIPGRTLLFLDEIQECPEAITSLKFWAEDRRFKVIASGSMLGMDYRRPSSYPVGYVSYLDMYALSFEEFLWAAGIQDTVLAFLRDCFEQRKAVPEPIHHQMMNYLKQYMIIGGMPEVVQTFADSANIAEVDRKQREILRDYRYDIAHYAPAEDKIKAESCYFSLPDQLGKPNHKFQYSVVEKGGNKKKYGSSLDWLANADLIHFCSNVTTVEYPLRNFKEEDNFRIYPGDIGLLIAMYDYSMKQALVSESTILSAGQAKGGLYEALVADLLLKNGHEELYFYKNDTTKIEIEFLIPSEKGIIPIEVKAGNNRSKSLDRILKSEEIAEGYKLISGNVGVTGRKITLPLYMAMFI